MRSWDVAPIINIIHTPRRATRSLNRPLANIHTIIQEIAAISPYQPTKNATMTAKTKCKSMGCLSVRMVRLAMVNTIANNLDATMFRLLPRRSTR